MTRSTTILYGLFIAIIILGSCRKDERLTRKDVIGLWELRYSIGFPESRFYEPGNREQLHLKKTVLLNGILRERLSGLHPMIQ